MRKIKKKNLTMSFSGKYVDQYKTSLIDVGDGNGISILEDILAAFWKYKYSRHTA